MAKTFLCSGNLDDHQAVGGGGQAVFDSALQIRETLRLHKQQAMVDCLAIPQINGSGDRVDWYSPIEGKAVAWRAADEETCFHVLRYLRSTLENAAALSRKSLRSGKTSLQLFGSLLEKAVQFPDENHVFLVDGRPVITFWGPVNLNENPRNDVLDCLRIADVPPMVIVAEPEQEAEIAPGITFAEVGVPLLTPVVDLPKPIEPEPQPPVIVNEPEVTVPPVQEKPIRRLSLWSLPVAAAIIAAIVGPLLWKRQTTQPGPAVAAAEVTKIDMTPLPALTSTPPLHRAEVTPTVKKEKPAEGSVVITAILKDVLVMDANQMKVGATRLLNGNWRVMVDVKNPVGGKMPSLRYQVQASKSTARVVHDDNIVCRAEIFSGLHQSGELMTKSRGNARCTDGPRYPMPGTTCKAGANDVAACTARYDDRAEIPLTIKKIGA